jgi:hypothetical protein
VYLTTESIQKVWIATQSGTTIMSSQRLVLTSYLTGDHSDLEATTIAALPAAMASAATRIDTSFTAPVTESAADGVVVHDGVEVLAGTTITWDRSSELTTLQVSVPWPDAATEPAVNRGRLLAANQFASHLSELLQAA